jgi:signal transduction histidine kinase
MTTAKPAADQPEDLPTEDLPTADGPTANSPIDSLQQLQLAYRSAIEMGQFKSGFLARTSHELRSPLNGLISGLQLILSDLCDDPAEEREYVQIAHDSALKLVELIDQVITVAKVTHGSYPFKMEAVDLDIALQEVFFLVRMQAANRNLKLHIPMMATPVEVMADMNCLRQALVLLIDSAIEAMQEGSISVAVITTAQVAQIIIADDRPADAWQELRTPAPPVAPSLDDHRMVRSPHLSSNFQLLLAKDLIEALQGELTLIEIDGKTHLQCSLKIV